MKYLVFLNKNEQYVEVEEDVINLGSVESWTQEDWEKSGDTPVAAVAVCDGEVHECTVVQVTDAQNENTATINRIRRLVVEKKLKLKHILQLITRVTKADGPRQRMLPLTQILTASSDSESDIPPKNIRLGGPRAPMVPLPPPPEPIAYLAGHPVATKITAQAEGPNITTPEHVPPTVRTHPAAMQACGSACSVIRDFDQRLRNVEYTVNEIKKCVLRDELRSRSHSLPVEELTFDQLSTPQDVDVVGRRLSTDVNFRTSMTQWLARSGGVDIRSCVRRLISRLFDVSLQRQCNRTGTRGKVSIATVEPTIKAAVRMVFPNATDMEVEHNLANYLRGAIDRQGGRERRRQQQQPGGAHSSIDERPAYQENCVVCGRPQETGTDWCHCSRNCGAPAHRSCVPSNDVDFTCGHC